MKSQTLKCKADQAMDYVIDWMRSGELKVGDRLPPERELCQRLGISRLTLNKAMARLEDLDLLKRAAGRGTHVAKLPANDAIAVICDIEHLTESYHSPSTDVIIKSLLGAARQGGLGPHFIVGSGGTAKDFIASLNMDSSVWREIKGVVAIAWKDGFEERLAEMGIPSVIISSWNQGRHSVILDYDALGRIAARLCAKAGAKKACVVHHQPDSSEDFCRPADSFADEAAKLGAGIQTLRVGASVLTPDRGFEMAGEIEAELNGCDALFISDDNLAAGFARRFEGRRPSNLKLILAQATKGAPPALPPSFKRISFDPAEVGARAIEALNALRKAGLESQAASKAYITPSLED